MCGRFVAAAPPEELAHYFAARLQGETLPANYNVAPTTEVYAVRAETDPDSVDDNAHRTLSPLRWGLVPFWAKDAKIGSKMINARGETAATNGAFRRPMARRRCLIPASAFYEWQAVPGSKVKQPYAIARADGEILAFGGLWDRWRNDNDVLESCTILTTTPNREMSAIHDRMPVLIPHAHFDRWVDPANRAEEVADLLKPAPDGLLSLTPVSTQVNRVANNGPSLLTPIEPQHQPPHEPELPL